MRRALCLLLVAACSTRSPKKDPKRDDDVQVVSIAAEGAVLRTGQIGVGQREVSTYVYVDVANRSQVDRLVTLEGSLVDDAGKALAPLPADEIRVPAGGKRTFALVAAKAFPAAKPSFHVANAVAVDYPPQVAVLDDKLTPGAIPVATATIKNTLDREVSAVVATTFYDAGGKILTRPFTVLTLFPGRSRPVRFEGPPAATAALTFVGQVAFH